MKTDYDKIRFWAGLASRGLGIAEVWIVAAFFNPPISSNVVWTIAIIYSSIQASLTGITARLVEVKERSWGKA